MKNEDHTSLTQPSSDTKVDDPGSPVEAASVAEESEKTVHSSDINDRSEAVSVPAASSKKNALFWFSVVLAIIALAVAGFAVWQGRMISSDVNSRLAPRLADNDRLIHESRGQVDKQEGMIKVTDDRIAAMQGKIGVLESQVAASAGQAAALESLYQDLFRSRTDRILAEVEQAINIAAQQLQLAGNIDAALLALQGAETRLSQSDQGQLHMLRLALKKDIDRLKESPIADIPGLAMRLEILLARIDKLPLAHSLTLQEEKDGQQSETDNYAFDYRQPMVFFKALGSDVWSEIRSLVRIENMDDANPVLLAPRQGLFLRENVKIRLLTARLALLARDGRTYSSDLAQARRWLEKYFDTHAEAVRETVNELADLESKDIKIEQFSLTDSFAALRTLQARPVPQPEEMQNVPAGGPSTTNSF